MVNFYSDSSFYVFSQRSCTNCTLFNDCVAHKNKDWSMKWLDCGRCGCEKYIGPYSDEISRKKKYKLKYERKKD